MLDRRKFLVREQAMIRSCVRRYEILDADLLELLGTAEETIGPLKKWLRRVVGTRVEVREKPDDSLVFVMRRGFFSRVQVLDSLGERVGYFKCKLSMTGAFRVYDKDRTPLANATGQLRFVTPDGTVELGRVAGEAGGFSLRVSPELDEQPLAKMLLVAAALAVDLSRSPSPGRAHRREVSDVRM